MASALPVRSTCIECGFSGSVPGRDTVDLVAAAPQRLRAILSEHGADKIRTSTVLPWSAVSYVWHLADVLRISAERLWALGHDPNAVVIAYDPDRLADVRSYGSQSTAAGVWTLERSTGDWLVALGAVDSNDSYDHPEFGQLTVDDVTWMIAHEVVHHARDIQRCLDAG